MTAARIRLEDGRAPGNGAIRGAHCTPRSEYGKRENRP